MRRNIYFHGEKLDKIYIWDLWGGFGLYKESYIVENIYI